MKLANIIFAGASLIGSGSNAFGGENDLGLDYSLNNTSGFSRRLVSNELSNRINISLISLDGSNECKANNLACSIQQATNHTTGPIKDWKSFGLKTQFRNEYGKWSLAVSPYKRGTVQFTFESRH